MNITKKAIGAVLGASALVMSAVGVTMAPASANPNWELWKNPAVGGGSALAVNDVITGSGTLIFTTKINGNPTRIECQTSSLFSHTVVSGDVAPIDPGASRTINITPPAVISTSAVGAQQGVCQDVTDTTWPFGIDIDVTTSGLDWEITLRSPSWGTSGILDGPIAGSLWLPHNGLIFEDTSIPCRATGPWLLMPAAVSGVFDTWTSTLTTGAHPFGVSVISGCWGGVTNTEWESMEIELSPELTMKY